MRGGPLRTPLEYQTKTQTPDSYNQPQDTWTTQGTYYGLVRSPSGREGTNALQMRATVSHVITTRYPGFLYDPTARFLYGTRILNIAYVLNVDERNRQVDIACTEVVKP